MHDGPEPGTRPCVTHVAFGTLVDYVRGLGSTAAREQVREHLSTCAHCEQAASRLTRLAEIGAADIDSEVPDEVVDEAIALFTSDASDRRALTDVDRFFTARSRSRLDDERPESRLRSQPRFLRFAAPDGEIDVHLLVIEETGVVLVSGQIVARKDGAPLDWEVSAHRGPDRDAIDRRRATPGGLFQLRYEAPAAALLRFVNLGAPSGCVDVPIDV
jgi:anti-sigma factor RsiW